MKDSLSIVGAGLAIFAWTVSVVAALAVPVVIIWAIIKLVGRYT